MNCADASPSREDLFWHVLRWELRRLAAPLAGWLAVSFVAVVLIHSADWSWPENNEEVLRQIRREKQIPVDAGMALAVAAVVYFTGELFIGLRPGTVRGWFALPPRRPDALTVAFLIQALLLIVPFLLYYRAWVMVEGWDSKDGQFVRQFLPPVPVFAAGLALVALLTGDWGLYLLVSTGIVMGIVWYDPIAFRRLYAYRPLPLSGGILIGMVSMVVAFAALRWRLRWTLLTLWVAWLAVMMKVYESMD